MFLKLNPTTYVNTERITTVTIVEDGSVLVTFDTLSNNALVLVVGQYMEMRAPTMSLTEGEAEVLLQWLNGG